LTRRQKTDIVISERGDTMIDKEKLIKSIMAECEKDGEPVTREEAEEMAEMEIKAGNVKRYEKSDKPRKKAERIRKVDENKKHLLDCVKNLLRGMDAKILTVKTETEFLFEYNDELYTIKLVKHRSKK
jgi:hypothetical protein